MAKENNIHSGKKTNTISSSSKKYNNDMKFETANELKKLSTILISIVGVICIFYIITVLVTKNNQELQYQVNDEISQISYTNILASDILKMDNAYYVLVKNNNDFYIELYNTYISAYTSMDGHLMVYTVDLDDALNKKYKSDQNNFSIDDLKFKDTVLLKIKDGNIESIYETSESINEHLKSLVSE